MGWEWNLQGLGTVILMEWIIPSVWICSPASWRFRIIWIMDNPWHENSDENWGGSPIFFFGNLHISICPWKAIDSRLTLMDIYQSIGQYCGPTSPPMLDSKSCFKKMAEICCHDVQYTYIYIYLYTYTYIYTYMYTYIYIHVYILCFTNMNRDNFGMIAPTNNY